MINTAREKGERHDGSWPDPSAAATAFGEFEIMPDEPDEKV